MGAQVLNGKCVINESSPSFHCDTVTDGSGQYVDAAECAGHMRTGFAFMYGDACVQIQYCGTNYIPLTCDECKELYKQFDPYCLYP